jgi:hypothetical protein
MKLVVKDTDREKYWTGSKWHRDLKRARRYDNDKHARGAVNAAARREKRNVKLEGVNQ